MSSGAKNGLKTTLFFNKNMNNGEVVTDTAKKKTLNKGLVKAKLVHFSVFEAKIVFYLENPRFLP